MLKCRFFVLTDKGNEYELDSEGMFINPSNPNFISFVGTDDENYKYRKIITW
jgi:hypothetical protein